MPREIIADINAQSAPKVQLRNTKKGNIVPFLAPRIISKLFGDNDSIYLAYASANSSSFEVSVASTTGSGNNFARILASISVAISVFSFKYLRTLSLP